nr:hypothetical protein [Tanacetum cinerariifolium]
AADTVQFGIALGQVLQPEMVVEVQVEQRSVHIQQNGVDIAPGQRRHTGLSAMNSHWAFRQRHSEKPRRLFRVEEVRFSNGVERVYERLVGRGNGYGAVMIVAMLDAEHAVLVEEYCGGTDEYELSLPKGLVEPGEDVLAAANRELKEEAGYGARQLEHLTELSLSPGYMSQKIQVVLATDLYEERLPGDEPEPM